MIPDACTLPPADQAPRLAELRALLTEARRTQRRSPTTLRLTLDPATEPQARDLTGRESECCPFFTFTFTRDGGDVHLDITVPATQAPFLDALAGR